MLRLYAVMKSIEATYTNLQSTYPGLDTQEKSQFYSSRMIKLFAKLYKISLPPKLTFDCRINGGNGKTSLLSQFIWQWKEGKSAKFTRK